MKQLSRKEKEFLARRKYILNAAREIFSRRGFAETTMEEIAEKAEFGKGTIYNYFASKADLFTTLIEEGVDGLIEIATVIGTKDLSPVDKISLLLRQQLKHFQANAGLFRIVHLEQKCSELPKIHQKIETIRKISLNIFADGVKKGVFKKYDPVKLGVMYSGFIHGFIFLYWAGIKEHAELTETEISEFLDCFLKGIINVNKEYENNNDDA